MQRLIRRAPQRRPAQALVLFTFMIVAILGMVALAIDLGLLFGQRRFDQNGADAAALAAARLMASNVGTLASGTVYFNVPDAMVYAEARKYAGLSPTSGSSAPTGTNQNPGLGDRTALAMTLEYRAGDSSGWCRSLSSPSPPRTPPVPACPQNLDAAKQNLPPAPTGGPYRIRVTVASTTDSFVAQVIGAGNVGPGPATSDEQPACLRPANDPGLLTCAQAIAQIEGQGMNPSGPLLPVTVGDCNLTQPEEGKLLELWSSTATVCGYKFSGSWQNVLDFTTETKWCDDPSGGSQSNPDYGYYELLPRAAVSPPLQPRCKQENGPDTWDRAGFVPDPNWGNDTSKTDLPYWIAKSFGGKIKPSVRYDPGDDPDLPPPDHRDGNKMPTYVDAKPDQSGNQGDNIALGFYCKESSATATSCPDNPSGTYFFAMNQPGFYATCPDRYGAYGLGCRDATIPTWDKPEWAEGVSGNSGGTGWKPVGTTGQAHPADRVRIIQLRNARIYCAYKQGLCIRPPDDKDLPKDLLPPGSAATARVYGWFVAPLNLGGDGNGGTPSPFGNVVRLVQ